MYIPESEVKAHLCYETLIPAIRQALMDYSAGRVQQPPRTILRTGDEEGRANGWFAAMPVIAGDAMAVKTVTFYPGNAELGIPTHMAIVELLRRGTGEPLAVMDGRLITEMRTAAVCAVAFAELAPRHFRKAPRSFGILGSGVQAHAHIEALRHVWPELAEIRIASRTRANAERLAAETGARAATAEDAAGADVVLTATNSATPVLMGRWMRKDAMVLAVGACGESLRELDDEAMQSSFVVAESRDCVERESGDVRLSGAKVSAEIGEVLLGTSGVPIPEEGRIVFKTVGMAIEDLTAARLVWESMAASR